MLNLKAIVNQLSTTIYRALEEQFIQSKAHSYLFLLHAYKENTLSDADIIEKLNANTTSFHTLRSRLYSKIQHHLLENTFESKAYLLNQLANINTYIYNTPNETADAILTKLAEDIKAYDMPGLRIVYSALKKIHRNTPKYYENAQLYTKHMDYMIALEKAEELLSSFMLILAEYSMSKAIGLLEMLELISSEIKSIYHLNPSYSIAIIKNISLAHIQLFTSIQKDKDESIVDLLEEIEGSILKYPINSDHQNYGLIANFLRYEYYTLINEHKKAQPYFEIVNTEIKYWLLLDNLCLSYHFLYSKIINYTRHHADKYLGIDSNQEDLHFNSKNPFTFLNLQFYYAISKFYTGQLKEAITLLNTVLNTVSFKSLLHIEIEVKLTLAYLYSKQNETELAEGLIRSIYRKIKAQDAYSYENAIVFSKLINSLMDFDNSNARKLKIINLIRLFEFENLGDRSILKFMESELNTLKTVYASTHQK